MALKKKQTLDAPPEPADSAGETQQAPEFRKPGRPREIQYSLDKKFTLLLPKDVHKALKVKSAELELPMTSMIIEAIKKTYNI
jgi:hypothetical protein